MISTLPLLFSSKLLKCSLVNCFVQRGKPQHKAMVEAKVPFKMAPTLMADRYKMFHNIHMIHMCRCVCSYHVSAALVCHAFGCYLDLENPGYPRGGNPLG